MRKETECRRLAEQLGWVEVNTLECLEKLGVPNAVHGQTVWMIPGYYKPRWDRVWIHNLDFDPWEDANDDLLVLELMKDMETTTWSLYKDCLYHETRGHGTHNVWEYKKGKFANAAIMLADKLGWR